MIRIHFCLNRNQLSSIDSILRIPIPSKRTSCIFYIPNIITRYIKHTPIGHINHDQYNSDSGSYYTLM
ncbi:BJ4_G0042210.mRNA.1.CDS.1 [Saccharomyces cerevisiae]|nr:BJ4_G0042210.mRNA.1.CDS.1 [Saccharomyces cerevisiae]